MKKLSIFVLVLFCVLNITGCSSKNKTFSIDNAKSLTVMSGTTGESIVITDSDDIKYITDNINSISFSKGAKVNSTGWTYLLCYQNASGDTIERLIIMSDGYTIIYDGYFYTSMSADHEIDLAFFDSKFTK